jgi:hypothetical protein
MRAVSLDDAKDWSTLVSTARKDFLVPPPGMPMTPQAADQEGMEPQVLMHCLRSSKAWDGTSYLLAETSCFCKCQHVPASCWRAGLTFHMLT